MTASPLSGILQNLQHATRIDARKEAAILADLRSGKAGIMKLAAAHRVGVGTVQRISRALALNAV